MRFSNSGLQASAGRLRPVAFGLALALPLLAAPARAHHLMEITGLAPTAGNGLLSGLAHPVIGPDHLAFLLALSLLGLTQRRRWMLALLAVGLLGTLLGLLLPGLPATEALLALTLVLEAVVLLGWLPRQTLVPAMALHGYGLSASVLGWSAMPVGTYLLGLLISQGLLLLAALALLRPLVSRLKPASRPLQALALVALAGALGLAAQLG